MNQYSQIDLCSWRQWGLYSCDSITKFCFCLHNIDNAENKRKIVNTTNMLETNQICIFDVIFCILGIRDAIY